MLVGLTGLLTTTAEATAWRSNLACELSGDGRFSDLAPQKPYAAILDRGELYVSAIHGLPPNTAFTCLVGCFLEGGFRSASCQTTDATGRLGPQRIQGFLPPGTVCAGIDFFLFDTGTGGDLALCADAVVVP
jgi:hypothetical protein